jgi:predicted anti-sigma-YlaC factor YlaD
MISCFLHQPALRRHLDDGHELSARTKAHLHLCLKCRELVAAHRAIIEHLSVRRSASPETPPFLHARIMNNLESAPRRQTVSPLRWAAATCSIAVLGAAIVLSLPKSPVPPTTTFVDLPTTIAFKTTLPENPLEQEIQNLRADTLNAAKALAATFLPEQDSK